MKIKVHGVKKYEWSGSTDDVFVWWRWWGNCLCLVCRDACIMPVCMCVSAELFYYAMFDLWTSMLNITKGFWQNHSNRFDISHSMRYYIYKWGLTRHVFYNSLPWLDCNPKTNPVCCINLSLRFENDLFRFENPEYLLGFCGYLFI